MTTLVIHDIRKEYFELDLAQYTLTFDDGLYSQYYYYPLLKRYNTQIIFFIITSFIKSGQTRKQFGGEYLNHVKPQRYMYDAFINETFSNFMTLTEVQALSACNRVKIGTHSHFHDVIIHDSPPKKPTSRWKIERCAYHPEEMNPQTSIRSRLAFQGFELQNGRLVQRDEALWMDFIKYDTELSLNWFETNLGFTPDIYSLPFNEYSDRMIAVLEGFGFKEFYGKAGKHKKIHARLDIDRFASRQVPSFRAGSLT